MLSRRAFNKLAVAAPFGLGLPSSARAQARLTVPIATWGSPTHINIVEFVAPLEAFLRRPKGRLRFSIFPPVNSRMTRTWPSPFDWQGQDRLVDAGAMVRHFSDARVADAPTGLTMQQFAAATDGADGIKAVLDKQMQTKGAKLLAVTDLGPVVIVSNKKVIDAGGSEGRAHPGLLGGNGDTLPRTGRRAAADPLRRCLHFAAERDDRRRADRLPGCGVSAHVRDCQVPRDPRLFRGHRAARICRQPRLVERLAEADRKIVGEGIAAAEAHCRRRSSRIARISPKPIASAA